MGKTSYQNRSFGITLIEFSFLETACRTVSLHQPIVSRVMDCSLPGSQSVDPISAGQYNSTEIWDCLLVYRLYSDVLNFKCTSRIIDLPYVLWSLQVYREKTSYVQGSTQKAQICQTMLVKRLLHGD